jgi:hypothetical protein
MKILETMLMNLYEKETEAAEASWCKEQLVMIFQVKEKEEESKHQEELRLNREKEAESLAKSQEINSNLLKRADTINSRGVTLSTLTQLSSSSSSSPSSSSLSPVQGRAAASAIVPAGGGEGEGRVPFHSPASPVSSSNNRLKRILKSSVFEVKRARQQISFLKSYCIFYELLSFQVIRQILPYPLSPIHNSLQPLINKQTTSTHYILFIFIYITCRL